MCLLSSFLAQAVPSTLGWLVLLSPRVSAQVFPPQETFPDHPLQDAHPLVPATVPATAPTLLIGIIGVPPLSTVCPRDGDQVGLVHQGVPNLQCQAWMSEVLKKYIFVEWVKTRHWGSGR